MSAVHDDLPDLEAEVRELAATMPASRHMTSAEKRQLEEALWERILSGASVGDASDSEVGSELNRLALRILRRSRSAARKKAPMRTRTTASAKIHSALEKRGQRKAVYGVVDLHKFQRLGERVSPQELVRSGILKQYDPKKPLSDGDALVKISDSTVVVTRVEDHTKDKKLRRVKVRSVGA